MWAQLFHEPAGNSLIITSLGNIRNEYERCKQFTRTLNEVLSNGDLDDRQRAMWEEIMRNEQLFPRFQDFLLAALRGRYMNVVKFLHQNMEQNLHGMRFHNRVHTPLSYLAYLTGASMPRGYIGPSSLAIFDYILKDSTENTCDRRGYTYLHVACFVGNEEAVERFIAQGVDVNLDTYILTPLRLAAQQRHLEIVRMLLDRGANPRTRDRERSTPLHKLARYQVCNCCQLSMNLQQYCGKHRPVDPIVTALLKSGAKIEARNKYGYTPLQLAASYFDVELIWALLRHGASLKSLYEVKAIDMNFTDSHDHLSIYPLAMNIVTMMRLLMSYGFCMNIFTRFRFLKCWRKVEKCTRILETVHRDLFTPEITDSALTLATSQYLNHKWEQIQQEVPENALPEDGPCAQSHTIDKWREEIEKLKEIYIDRDKTASLYEICRKTPRDAYYSSLYKFKDLFLPELHDFLYTRVVVKRHMASVLMRPHLELFAADLMMTKHLNLNLPYLPCRMIAKNLSDQDLILFCDRTSESDIVL